MAGMNAATICTNAMQVAKAPGYSTQASDCFNARLEELAQLYDFDQNRATTVIQISPGGAPNADGSYNLPSDYLRSAKGDLFYQVNDVTYTLFQISLEEYDALLKTNTLTSYPNCFATDMSLSPPAIYLYPPTAVVTNLTIRYQKQPTDVATPTSNTTTKGWLPLSRYLWIALSADLMRFTDDVRQTQFEDDARGILRDYFKMHGDTEGFSRSVKLDPRLFRSDVNMLPATKLAPF